MIYDDNLDRLHRLIKLLASENPEVGRIALPGTKDECRNLLRALMNVRPPLPASMELLELQDAELRAQLEEKGVVSVSDTESVAHDPLLRLWQGDITRLSVDAIVNAANCKMLGCFVPLHRCIDNAIHSAAGIQLRGACDEIMRRQGHDEPTGSAKITAGYNLPCRYVIHTVGPIVPDTKPSQEQKRQLADCYRSCLAIAETKGVESIAFCCISTGEFGFPNRPAAEIAVSTVRGYLDENSGTTIKTVVFNVFKDMDYEIYRKLLD